MWTICPRLLSEAQSVLKFAIRFKHYHVPADGHAKDSRNTKAKTAMKTEHPLESHYFDVAGLYIL